LHDALQLEALGVPAAVVITEPFTGLVGSFSRNLGAPGYPPMVVPHPISSKDDEHLRRMAEAVADAVAVQLAGRAAAG
jgi:hypothetical protein